MSMDESCHPGYGFFILHINTGDRSRLCGQIYTYVLLYTNHVHHAYSQLDKRALHELESP